MADAKAFIDSLKTQYDKLITFLVLLLLLGSLVYLAVHVGLVRSMQRGFESEIGNMRPRHPTADAVAEEPYHETEVLIEKPEQLAAQTGPLLVPEARVWCIDCRRPIPIAAMICPFCKVEQPQPADKDWTRDTDKDGIPNLYEVKFGLDQLDPRDALIDSDGDGFINIVEFTAAPRNPLDQPELKHGTDPRDPSDYPPVEDLLFVEDLDARPFYLRFRSVSKMPPPPNAQNPDGYLKFQLNLQIGGQPSRTFFVRLGEEVLSFTVARYEEKIVMRPRPGWPEPRPVDESELTLKRGDLEIVLIVDKDVQHNEYTAHLIFTLTDETFELKLNDTFRIKDKEYRLISIDSDANTVVVERLHDGQTFKVRPLPERGAPGATAAQGDTAAQEEGPAPAQGEPAAPSDVPWFLQGETIQ